MNSINKKKRNRYFSGDALAVDVWESKYRYDGEITPDNMHLRMAKEFARVDGGYQEKEVLKIISNGDLNLSKYGANREDLTTRSIFNLFKDFKYIVPQGSIMSQLGNDNQIGSLSNCFVIGQPEDSYGGILLKDQELVQLMKRRGGVGIDISTLRPNDTPTSNAAKTSTGAISFMERFSNSTREVAQNGRRGALMLSIDVRHPDVADFVTIKNDRTKVTGANISISLRDDFMEAVKKDEDYVLQYPIDADISRINPEFFEAMSYNYLHDVIPEFSDVDSKIWLKKVRAKELYDLIIENAWDNAEPGQIFIDKHWNYSPDGVYPQYRGITTNPSLRQDTLIQTDLGLFSIKELAETDGLTIIKNIRNEWKVGKVFMSGKNKQLFKITFTNGYEVFCTADHKWPILNTQKNIFNKNNGKIIKKRTDELMFGHPKKGGDRTHLLFDPNYEGNISCKFTNEDGFLSGYWLGDGHTSICSDGRQQYGFIVSEQELNDCGTKLMNIINEYKFKKTETNFNRDHNTKAFHVTCSEVGFRNYCNNLELGYDKNVGIPLNIFKGGNKFIKGFIDGLFSSDGSVWANKDLVHSRVTLTSSRINIVKDTQKLLNLFGISSNIQKGKTILNDKEFIRYNLVISGMHVRKFALTFKLTSKHKQESLETILSYENTYIDDREYLVVKNVEATNIYEDVYDITVYDDTHTFRGEFGTTSNCGEIFMQPYDACRLMAINLYSFVNNKFTNNATIDFDLLYRVSYEQQRLADDLVNLELEKIDIIINKIKNDVEKEETKAVELQLWENIREVAASGRRTGCGFTGLGDMIAAMGVNYDSEESMKIIDEVMKTKMRGELDCTIDLAILRGSFDGYDNSLEYKNGVGTNDFYKFLKKNFKQQYKRMISKGRRNISLSTVAPTGSVSILTQTTSGLEPVFSVFPYLRRKKINPNDETARIDFTDENGDEWQEFPVTHKGLMDFIRIQHSHRMDILDLYDKEDKNKEELEELVNLVIDFINTETSPYSNSSANDIDWISRVKIQSIIQKYTTHSISSTINLPNDVKQEEVAEIYMTSWDMGLKGVTIYRDGCRTGVLITKKVDPTKEIIYNDAPKRPQKLECEIFHPKVKGQTYTVIIGLLKGKVYEVFAVDKEIAKGHPEAINKKMKSGHYSLITKDTEEMIHDNVGDGMSENEEMFTRALSGALRHGMHVKHGVEMCNNGKGDITSFTKVIARTLKRYIEDGTTSSKKCGDCGATDSMIYEEGCSRCKICGSSKCG
jgi:ribonucleotide reductase alpha subunit/predicted Zn-ribbon and HTH transcriptional regulator